MRKEAAFRALGLAAVVFCLSGGVAAQQNPQQPPPPVDAQTAIEAYVRILWHQGDLVSYVSPSRGFALVVVGHEDVILQHHGDLYDGNFAVAEYLSTEELAYASADIQPQPGDEYTMVNSECQTRTHPCDATCRVRYPNFVRDLGIGDFGQCQRIRNHPGSCKQTFEKVCDRQAYADQQCLRALTTPSTPVHDWNCK